MNKLSERRLKENQVIFRAINKAVMKYNAGSKGQDTDSIMGFYCECSQLKCRERISLTPGQYEQIHQSKKQFIVLPGHEIPEIERVLEKGKGFQVVEKYGRVPSSAEVSLV